MTSMSRQGVVGRRCRCARWCAVVAAFVLPALAAPGTPARAQDGPSAPADGPMVGLIDLRDVPLREALRLFSQQTGLRVVASAGAQETDVSLYLADTPAVPALDSLCKAHDLWFRYDDEVDIYRIYTTEEYQRDLLTFREEQTEVFTLLYPNALDVAVAIRDVFGPRVVLSLGVDEEEYLDELEQRFERFDVIDERSRGLGLELGGGQGAGSGRSGGRFGGDSRGRSGRGGGGLSSGIANVTLLQDRDLERDVLEDLSPEEIEALERVLSGQASGETAEVAEAILRQRANIFVTVVRRHNKIVVRTGDPQSMDQIEQLIGRLDVPTPLVLLEVRVLSVELGDGFESAFDFSARFGDFSAGFGNGTIEAPQGSNIFGGTGIEENRGVFQVVGGNVDARLQLLESENRITELASPLILTANNEVSRVFIGREVPILKRFTPPQTIVSDAGNVTNEATPVYEDRLIGTQLLITPSINSDRTVNLRIVQATTSVVTDGAEILVPPTNEPQLIDIVANRSVAGTVIAEDATPIILGGLIEEGVRNLEEKLPILGDIPLLSLLFKRDSETAFRNELVVVIRPYVLSTPADGDRLSRELLDTLSIHPSADDLDPTLDMYNEGDIPGNELRRDKLERLFDFHNQPGTGPLEDPEP